MTPESDIYVEILSASWSAKLNHGSGGWRDIYWACHGAAMVLPSLSEDCETFVFLRQIAGLHWDSEIHFNDEAADYALST